MAEIQIKDRAVWYSPTAKRCFFTKRAAASREASAMIQAKYPTEPMESDEIGITFRGWHWSDDDRLRRLHARLTRQIRRALG